MANVYGFTLLRNGVKFDYSFKECLKSLSPLVSKIYIALGDCEDGTREALAEFDNLEIIDTVWDPSLMGDGGQILSEQTNVALDRLRSVCSDDEDAWGFYLQCDELLHESEITQIKKDIDLAHKNGCDAVRFRYFHFWQSHYEIALSKRWYPHEVRAVKLSTSIKSFGDAQGFSGVKNPFESECRILHYGHVREEESYKEKQKLLIQMIRPAEKFKKYFNREKKAFAETLTAKVLMKHPSVMEDRILRMGEAISFPKKELVYIVSKERTISSEILDSINAENVFVVKKSTEVPFEHRFKNMIVLNPGFMDRLEYDQKKSYRMKSNFAREWDLKNEILLRLSDIGVSLRN